MACDALGYPLGFVLTGANVSDFDQAKPLLKAHLRPGALAIMDKGYDSDAIRAYVNQLGGVAVIALHPRRSIPPAFDQHIYREVRLPRFDGRMLGPNKGNNDDQEEGSRGNAPAV